VLARNALCSLADHFLELVDGHRLGSVSVDRAVSERRAGLFLVLRGCNECIYAEGAAEIDVMDVVEGKMDLLTLNDGEIGEVSVSLYSFK
jgi:hypothetical protein